jgi:hypothetical protein
MSSGTARGKVFKAALGRVGTLTLPDARDVARIYVGEIAKGHDPIAEAKVKAKKHWAEIEAAWAAKIEAEQERVFTD